MCVSVVCVRERERERECLCPLSLFRLTPLALALALALSSSSSPSGHDCRFFFGGQENGKDTLREVVGGLEEALRILSELESQWLR
jgi:hypothetical protein